MGREQKTRQIKLEEHASNRTHVRFGGVDERAINDIKPARNTWYEDRLEEFGGDPRVMATDAEMRAQGFEMLPGQQYRV